MREQKRTDLWYGRYNHCLRFSMPEASVLRYLNPLRIDRAITMRREWGKRMLTQANPGSWLRAWAKVEITDRDVTNLHTMCYFLNNDKRDRKLVISGDIIYLYTTELSLVRDVRALPYIKDPVHTQAVKIGDPNTVRMKKPRYAFRTYLRSRVLTAEQIASLNSFIGAQEDIRPSPTLRWFLKNEHGRSTRTFDYYFIDHDDQGLITMLGLIVSGIVRKTVPILADK